MFLLIIITFLSCQLSNQQSNDSRRNVNYCKISQTGIEFSGFVSSTVSRFPCQFWSSNELDEKTHVTLENVDFVDGSKLKAKNYCRNPNNNPNGPWCYTFDSQLSDDVCDIPLCNFGECRISGGGVEYSGIKNIAVSGKQCKSWNNKYPLISGKETEKFSSKKFADLSRKNAKKYCRNPDDDAGGPWCYVDHEHEIVVKEYCDIPFCDDRNCLIYTRESSTYSTITKLNITTQNITIWIKLWNPKSFKLSKANLVLSHLPIPSSGERIAKDWKAGVELSLSNIASGLLFPQLEDRPDFESTPQLIVGSKWTGLSINWAGGLISVSIVGSSKQIIMAEYYQNNTISSLYPETFLYYGFSGSGVLWSTEFCENNCEVHTTFGLEFIRVWPLQFKEVTFKVQFYVRAMDKIQIQFYQTPANVYPSFKIILDDDIVYLKLQTALETQEFILKSESINKVLNYYKWKKFTISIFGSHMRFYVHKEIGKQILLTAGHDLLATIRWFSIGSDGKLAHWSLFCSPESSDPIESPLPPNCLSSLSELKYLGNEWVSENGFPCVPWQSDEVPMNERKEEDFMNGTLKAINKCRNPSNDANGPYCYVLKNIADNFISKDYCSIRTCRSLECRIAGTANDYIGKLSTTRSGRNCTSWITNYDLYHLKKRFAFKSLLKHYNVMKRNQFVKPIHQIDPKYLNNSLYPEHSVQNASNFCRNPSESIAGTWCYTSDPLVPQDLCDVKDCNIPDECISFVRGTKSGRRWYILPQHRANGIEINLKQWQPNYLDSFIITFHADEDFSSKYILHIDAKNFEKIILHYKSEGGDLELLKEKSLPHLLFISKWMNFIIKIPKGKIEVYYGGDSNPIFSWENTNPKNLFVPVFYSYSTELGNTIGVGHNCFSKCPVEVTNTIEMNQILPVSIQHENIKIQSQTLMLMIRGKGVVTVPLLLFPESSSSYYGLTFSSESDSWIRFFKNNHRKVILQEKKIVISHLFSETCWSNFTIEWFNETLNVWLNGSRVFHYIHTRPLLFYYFSLIVNHGGQIMWSANCIPLDIYGEPVDGGWSEWGPWACSATCNGGVGIRKRVCNNPEPNIKGEPCFGIKMISGKCNTIRCGDISDNTDWLIKQKILKHYTSLKVKEGQRVTISSDPDVIKKISLELMKPQFNWSHNGLFVHLNDERFINPNFDLIIKRCKVNDSGVYTITLHRVDETHLILKAVTLAVYPVTTILSRRETLSLTVLCHSTILGYLYSDLKINWLINNKLYKNYGTTLPISVDVDTIIKLNQSHSGIWECLVKQEDFHFNWITNVISVDILGPPNWKTHLMEDQFTKPIFAWMQNETLVGLGVFFIFFTILCIIILFSYFYIKFMSNLRGRMYKKTNNDKSVKKEEKVALLSEDDN